MFEVGERVVQPQYDPLQHGVSRPRSRGPPPIENTLIVIILYKKKSTKTVRIMLYNFFLNKCTRENNEKVIFS